MNILCFGDSNTWGYKPDKSGRYDENIRWTGLLQKKLGSGYHIIEEGLCGRTTVFQDELREGRRGLDLIGVTVEMHNPIDLMIIMLGTLPRLVPSTMLVSVTPGQSVVTVIFVFLSS